MCALFLEYVLVCVMNPYRVKNGGSSLDRDATLGRGVTSIVNFNHTLSSDDLHVQMERLNVAEPAQRIAVNVCAGTVGVLSLLVLIWVSVIVIHPEVLQVITCWLSGACAHLVS